MESLNQVQAKTLQAVLELQKRASLDAQIGVPSFGLCPSALMETLFVGGANISRCESDQFEQAKTSRMTTARQHIMWPRAHISGCMCIDTNEKREEEFRQKRLSVGQFWTPQSQFQPLQAKNTDSAHCTEQFSPELRSLKRVKLTSYGITQTGSLCFGKADKVDARTNGDFHILPVASLNSAYTLQSYHILSFEREAPTDSLGAFRTVYGILRSIFKNSMPVEEIGKLAPESFMAFGLIVEKKFKINLCSPEDATGLARLAEVVANRTVQKRPEECKKIVFSYTIKQLKHRLRDQYTQQYRKTGFDEFFYQFYFERIAITENIALEDFYYPIASTKCKKNSAKTINASYLANIRLSEKFMGDMSSYIHSHLTKDYAKEIDCKLLDLVTRWELEAKKTSSLSELRTALGSYFKGSKSKLPWTIHEVQHAIEKVKNVIS